MNSLVKRFFKHWSSRKYNLASYIKVEEGQFFFNLDEKALRKIHQVRIRGFPLYLPCSLRLRLLRHALLHIGSTTSNKRKKANTYLLPGLAFYTCYSDAQEERNLEHIYLTPSTDRKKKLLRSLISPDGDIFNQICSSTLQHPHFLEISATHYWLTTQLLNHLHANLNWVPRSLWFISFLIAFIATVVPVPFISTAVLVPENWCTIAIWLSILAIKFICFLSPYIFANLNWVPRSLWFISFLIAFIATVVPVPFINTAVLVPENWCTIAIKFICFLFPYILMGFWIWCRPSIIWWALARIL